MAEIKTLQEMVGKGLYHESISILKDKAIRLINNLQGPETIYSFILYDFPEDMKGEYAKDKWNDSLFTYGAEYGMLAFIMWFFNITKEDLKQKKQKGGKDGRTNKSNRKT